MEAKWWVSDTGKECARQWKSFLKYAPGVMGSAIHDNSRGAEEIRGDEFGWYGTEESHYVMSAKAAVG